jgi:hypothetical protein
MNGLWVMGWGFTKSSGLGWESYTLVGLHLAMEFWSSGGQALLSGDLRKDMLGDDERISYLLIFQNS